MTYPHTRRDDTVDNLHGTAVPDPYRWLEDADNPEVQEWVAAQRDFTEAQLQHLPARGWFTELMGRIVARPRAGVPLKRAAAAGSSAATTAPARRTSSSRPSDGCTGTTRSASTATSATSRPPSSSRRSMLAKPTAHSWSESNSASLHQTQCGSREHEASHFYDRARLVRSCCLDRGRRPCLRRLTCHRRVHTGPAAGLPNLAGPRRYRHLQLPRAHRRERRRAGQGSLCLRRRPGYLLACPVQRHAGHSRLDRVLVHSALQLHRGRIPRPSAHLDCREHVDQRRDRRAIHRGR